MVQDTAPVPLPADASADTEEARFLSDQFAKQAIKTVLLKDDVGMVVLDGLVQKPKPSPDSGSAEPPPGDLDR
jgi:hypothetical protein